MAGAGQWEQEAIFKPPLLLSVPVRSGSLRSQRFQLGSVWNCLIVRPNRGGTVCPLMRCDSQQSKIRELARPEDVCLCVPVCSVPVEKWLGEQRTRQGPEGLGRERLTGSSYADSADFRVCMMGSGGPRLETAFSWHVGLL